MKLSAAEFGALGEELLEELRKVLKVRNDIEIELEYDEVNNPNDNGLVSYDNLVGIQGDLRSNKDVLIIDMDGISAAALYEKDFNKKEFLLGAMIFGLLQIKARDYIFNMETLIFDEEKENDIKRDVLAEYYMQSIQLTTDIILNLILQGETLEHILNTKEL